MAVEPVEWGDVLAPRRIREELSLSQSGLARLLGVSLRAVQRWEQGWRRPSGGDERAMLLLLLASRNGPRFAELACWEHVACAPDARDACIVYQCRQGHLCRLLTGNSCQGKRLRTWPEKKVGCGECEFMGTLLNGPSPSAARASETAALRHAHRAGPASPRRASR